jgi:hypothetical protein
MRQNMVIVLLSVCCTLLAVNLYVTLGEKATPTALGQAAANNPTSQVAIATSQDTSNSPVAFIYEVGTQRLAAYKVGNRGIELKGLRQITWDLRLEELNPALASRAVKVQDIRRELEKAGK